MQVDAQIQAWLDAFPAPEIDYRDVDAVRALTAGYMADQGGPAPRWSHPDVSLTRSTVAGVPVMVWQPKELARPAPAVVALHGGAFIVGSPLGAERIAVPLAARHGVITISVDYRLAPEHRAPAALDDALRVINNLHVVPQVDTSRLAVHGSSAGASIAAGLALVTRASGPRLALQSLSCPALDHRTARTADPRHSMRGYSPTLTRDAVAAMWEHYLGDREATPYVVPALVADLRGSPPAHLTIAEHDVLRDEALAFARRMSEAGVVVEIDLVAGAVHGFDGLLPDFAISERAVDRQVNAMAMALAGA